MSTLPSNYYSAKTTTANNVATVNIPINKMPYSGELLVRGYVSVKKLDQGQMVPYHARNYDITINNDNCSIVPDTYTDLYGTEQITYNQNNLQVTITQLAQISDNVLWIIILQ